MEPKTKPMDANTAAKLLAAHNRWRRWDGVGRGPAAVSPEQIGRAIEVSVDALTKHAKAMDVLRQIASMPRRTREQRLAASCLAFLDAL